MRYLLLIYGPPWDPTRVTPEQMQASMDEWTDFTADLMRRGVMEAGEALEGIETATTVRLRNGETLTTDGPFAETAEVLGGYYVLKCKDLDEAIKIAAACPGRPGRIDRVASDPGIRRGVSAGGNGACRAHRGLKLR